MLKKLLPINYSCLELEGLGWGVLEETLKKANVAPTNFSQPGFTGQH